MLSHLPRAHGGRAAPHRRDERRRRRERGSVDEERHRIGRDREQDRSDCRTYDHTEVLHRVQESVGGRQPGLTDHPREHRHRRRPLCRSRRRGQRGQGDHELYRAFGRDRGGEGEHERAAQEIADQEHRAPVVAIGDHAAHGAEQHVREQPADRRRPDPPGRSRGGVDVSQQSGVEEPVPELRRRAGPYERTGIVNCKNAAVGATGAHGPTLVVSHRRRKRFGRSHQPHGEHFGSHCTVHVHILRPLVQALARVELGPLHELVDGAEADLDA